MPASTLSKGYEEGWLPGETGWGAALNRDLLRVNAEILSDWAHDPVSTVGLTYAFRGGLVLSGTLVARVAGGSIVLPALTTSYVERTAAGVVSSNTSAFSAGSIPLAKVTTDASSITGVEDWRSVVPPTFAGDDQRRNLTLWGFLAAAAKVSGSSLELNGTASSPSSGAGLANDGSAGVAQIFSASESRFWVNGANRWLMNAAGHLRAATDASYDIGGAGVGRPRSVYISGGYTGETAALSKALDGVVEFLTLTNSSNGSGAISRVRFTNGLLSAIVSLSTPTGGLLLGTESQHPVIFQAGATQSWTVRTDGHFYSISDGAYDIGGSATGRPRDLHLTRAIYAATIALTGAASVGGNLGVSGDAEVGTLTSLGFLRSNTGASKAARATGVLNGATTLDLSTANNFELSIIGNATLTLNNPVQGAWYTFFVTQDSTGGWTISWPGSVRWSYGSPPVLSGAGKTDTISLYWNGSFYVGFSAGANA